VRVEVSDDGRGFAAGDAAPPDGKSRGFGLVGMTERGRLVGADVSVVSSPGKGTRVTVSLSARDGADPPMAS
jgi:signal transduction histidine kinase